MEKQMMKAIYLKKHGDSRDAFEIREKEIPVPGKGEVLVRVEASGLNFADVMARRGLYKAAPPLPSVLGYDIAGTIHTLGPETNGLQVGQRVAAMTRFGGYAEYALTQAGAVVPIPAHMDACVATALATQASTAVYCAKFTGRLYAQDRVLIHAAAGGVGIILIQLAKAAGCVVYGSASGNKHAFLKQLGVDFTIDSRSSDPLMEVGRLLSGQPLDVIFDNVGGLSYRKGLALLGPGGRMVAYGAASQNTGRNPGKIRSIRVGLGFGFHSPVGQIVRSQSVHGVNMLSIADHKPAILKEVMNEVERLYGEGIIQPVAGQVFPATGIAEAHAYLESRQSIGKIAILW